MLCDQASDRIMPGSLPTTLLPECPISIHMHIETTTRCTLACPGCPRTQMAALSKRPFPRHDLDLDLLLRFLACDSGKLVKHFLLCGNHGDPIYYPDLLPLVEALRPATFSISTNGSHVKPAFWHGLSAAMTPGDTIYFSIDGTRETNHLYRRNADWHSIMQGLDIMARSPARVVWKTLVFSFNQHQLAEIKQLAEDRGAIFHHETTGYFGDESLRPRPHLVRQDLTHEHSRSAADIDPRCADHARGFVSADGYYWPCCLISSAKTLYGTQLWKDRRAWKMSDHTLDTIRGTMEHWAAGVASAGSAAHSVCKMHCKRGQKKYVWPTI